MSLTHWERRYHLFLLACYAGFAGFAIAELARGAARLHPLGGRREAGGGGARPPDRSPVDCAQHARRAAPPWSASPLELLPAARYLERATAKDDTVMAMRAQIAQLSRREWRELPVADSLDQLERALRERPADYVVYDRWMRRLRPGLARPRPPRTDACRGWSPSTATRPEAS